MISMTRKCKGLFHLLIWAAAILFIITSVHKTCRTTPEVKVVKKLPFYPFPYLCPKLTGGIGNSMFVYATVYALAATTQRHLILPFNNLEDIFENLIGDVNKELCDPELLPNFDSKWNCAYDSGLLNIPPGKNYMVGNYLQSYKYFENYTDDIRQLFQVKEELRYSAGEFLKEIETDYRKSTNTNTTSNITFISVHVRRGDMLQSRFYNAYGYNIPDEKYIRKAMKYMERLNSNIVFIFVSNDLEWVKSTFKAKNIYFSKFTNAKQDFALLSSCNHSITTVGTYGWWSAYLAGGTTIYYKYPAREGSELRQHFSEDYSDFFLPEWIGLI